MISAFLDSEHWQLMRRMRRRGVTNKKLWPWERFNSDIVDYSWQIDWQPESNLDPNSTSNFCIVFNHSLFFRHPIKSLEIFGRLSIWASDYWIWFNSDFTLSSRTTFVGQINVLWVGIYNFSLKTKQINSSSILIWILAKHCVGLNLSMHQTHPINTGS